MREGVTELGGWGKENMVRRSRVLPTEVLTLGVILGVLLLGWSLLSFVRFVLLWVLDCRLL